MFPVAVNREGGDHTAQRSSDASTLGLVPRPPLGLQRRRARARDPFVPGDPVVLDPEDPPVDTGTAPPAPDCPEFDCWADVSFDNQQDGTIDGGGLDGYDAANPTWLLYSDRDTNGNGIVETVDLYERDADGNAIRYERQRRDAQTIERTFGDDGLLLSEAIDLASDGFVDEVHRYEYDPNGELLRSETDFGDDGELDYVVEYTLTPDGDRISGSRTPTATATPT